jgi:hypothetical protein
VFAIDDRERSEVTTFNKRHFEVVPGLKVIEPE